jgi:DNA-binding transcriptional LysR family regulator
MICASPAYWAAHGVPQRPADLAQHTCLLFRGPEGAVLDLWRYERAGVSESIAVTGWLVSSHRDALLDAVLAGEGVGRFTDITVREHLRSGRLVPALLDWETKDGPPVHLLYRAGHKRTPRVRLFVDFATRLFAQLDAQRDEGVAARLSAERPQWYRRAYSRASAVAR